MTLQEINPSTLSQTVPGLRAAGRAPSLDVYELRHPRPFLCELAIDGSQLSEVIPHVSNVEFVRWLDRAAELHSDAVGWTRERLLNDGIMWFVARHEIDYLAEVWPGDNLFIATWVRDFGRVKSWRDYAIFRPSDETIVCSASTLWVLVGLEKRRPVRIPVSMQQAFEALDAIE